jgi:hypothetical protein
MRSLCLAPGSPPLVVLGHSIGAYVALNAVHALEQEGSTSRDGLHPGACSAAATVAATAATAATAAATATVAAGAAAATATATTEAGAAETAAPAAASTQPAPAPARGGGGAHANGDGAGSSGSGAARGAERAPRVAKVFAMLPFLWIDRSAWQIWAHRLAAAAYQVGLLSVTFGFIYLLLSLSGFRWGVWRQPAHACARSTVTAPLSGSAKPPRL